MSDTTCCSLLRGVPAPAWRATFQMYVPHHVPNKVSFHVSLPFLLRWLFCVPSLSPLPCPCCSFSSTFAQGCHRLPSVKFWCAEDIDTGVRAFWHWLWPAQGTVSSHTGHSCSIQLPNPCNLFQIHSNPRTGWWGQHYNKLNICLARGPSLLPADQATGVNTLTDWSSIYYKPHLLPPQNTNPRI